MKSSSPVRHLLKIILLLFIMTVLSTVSCNKDGIGIYYQISQEEAQAESEISELKIHQVVEASGTVYARAGLSVWKQSGSNWSKISGDNYVYTIVTYSNTLYANINSEVNSLDDGRILSYDGSVWSGLPELSYSGAIDLIQLEHEPAYLLMLGTGGVAEVRSSTDLTDLGNATSQSGTINFIDGAELGGTYFGISRDTIYSDALNASPSALSPVFDIGVSGDYRALFSDTEGTENIYLTTSTGQVYSSTDGTSWTQIGDITDEPVRGSMDIVAVGATDYLIIGTEDGYYEMALGGGSVVGPTATADTAGPSEFAAKYPELSIALVFDVYTTSGGTLYLATQEGLWKRNADGSFSRQ